MECAIKSHVRIWFKSLFEPLLLCEQYNVCTESENYSSATLRKLKRAKHMAINVLFVLRVVILSQQSSSLFYVP